MATIDLTLNSFKVPDIDGYTPPFGTKITRTEANKGGLSTVEVNNNVLLPFAMMRPKTVTEDSLTTNVEYDAKVVFSSSLQAATTLSIGNGTYEGCEVLVKNLSTYTCTVDHGAWSVDIPVGGYVKIEWNGSAWSADVSAAVQAAIAAKMPDYSTSEQLTGRKWIDGKDEYCCSFVLSGTISKYGYTNVGISIPANFAGLTSPVQVNTGVMSLIYFNNTTLEAATSVDSIIDLTGYVATLFYTKSDPTP